MQNSKSTVVAAIAGICAILAISIFSIGFISAVNIAVDGFVKYKSTGVGGITATGSASKDFVSDLVTWGGNFYAYGGTTKEAYEIIKRDAEVIKKYLLDNGVSEDDLTFYAVDIQQQFRSEYNAEGKFIGDFPDGYRLSQRIYISSSDVDKIQDISRDITRLIDSGVDFYPDSPEYYYTKLDELKLEMIEEATQNAKQRIDILAENSNSGVGKLLNANLGVFQITALNSSTEEYSSSGVFNTWSKWKTASITVKLYYAVD